jgi:hypothetical protein
MKLTAEVLTILLGTLKLVGELTLPWAVILTPVLLKYVFWTWITWTMQRARKR